ncbi:MAG TPA: hypothetical protein VFZ01_00135 [Geminicoccaceae bacterium]
MQNRNMFPFRRQGPKKRNKNNNARRVRGAPKGLPNSARDLLPVLQPATKALAQMLAGRTNVSGQLAHAQSVLAHAERLIAERTHNRLNPSEREEFFEQLARLRLTIADAEAEAEVVAAEEQQPKPAVVPVDQERLRAMALALTRPAEDAAPVTRAPGAPEEAPGAAGPEASPEPSEAPPAPAPEDEPGRESRVSAANARSGRLQLSRPGDDDPADPHGAPARGTLGVRRSRLKPGGVLAAANEPAGVGGNGSEAATLRDGPPDAAAREPAAEPAAPPAPRRRLKPEPQPERETDEEDPAASGDEPESNGAGLAMRRPRRRKTAGLPDGWVIDDEGFVVPGPR